jgi:hypothetical protein
MTETVLEWALRRKEEQNRPGRAFTPQERWRGWLGLQEKRAEQKRAEQWLAAWTREHYPPWLTRGLVAPPMNCRVVFIGGPQDGAVITTPYTPPPRVDPGEQSGGLYRLTTQTEHKWCYQWGVRP